MAGASRPRTGKTNLDHVDDMLDLVAFRGITYKTVLVDSWYSTTQVMTRLIRVGKLFHCPIKKNRRVDDSRNDHSYIASEALAWTPEEEAAGKTVKPHGFTGATPLKLFQVALSTEGMEYIVINEVSQDATTGAQSESARC